MSHQSNKIILCFILALCFIEPVLAQFEFRVQQLCLDNNEACDIGDINRDGYPDIVAGRLWYAGPDFKPRPVRPIPIHPPDYAQNNGEHLFDVNQDGWLDVITTGWGESNLLYFENPGKTGLDKGLPWKQHVYATIGHGHGETGTLLDLNGDGNPEYVLNSYIKTRPFSFWEMDLENPQEYFIGPKNSHGVGYGDINGDGRTDILIDRGWYEQPEDMEKVPWKLHMDWKRQDGSCPMIVDDLNGDGRSDIIAGHGHDYGLYWYEQLSSVGDSTRWKKHVIDTAWSQVHTLLWTDLNADGQKELITGKRVKAHSGKDPGSDDPIQMFVYSWKDNAFFKQIICEGRVGTGLIIRDADLNQDGRQDLVVAGKSGTYILWQE